jgi:hypothetical protein
LLLQVLGPERALDPHLQPGLLFELFDERLFCLTVLGPVDGDGLEKSLQVIK